MQTDNQTVCLYFKSEVTETDDGEFSLDSYPLLLPQHVDPYVI